MLPSQFSTPRSQCHVRIFGNSAGRRTVHLGGHDGSGKDTATDGDQAGERALLVDVVALNGVLGCAEAQTNILDPSPAAGVLAGSADLVVQEDVRLSRRISTQDNCIAKNGLVVPASDKRAPTGHYFAISSRSCAGALRSTHVSSVAMVAVGWYCRLRRCARTSNFQCPPLRLARLPRRAGFFRPR